jgi:peptide/nickel transport system ATP-binding protein/oligopeptide transport system ATP-binding protein
MSVPLLDVRDLSKTFPFGGSFAGWTAREIRAVDGVSFHVSTGETLALIGESGCGKSTAGRLILRLIEATRGKVYFDGQDLSGLDAKALRGFRAKAQLIFQDPYASLNPGMSIGAALAEPLMLHAGLNKAGRRARTAELLSLVGLNREHAARYPHELSGGQRQRVAIARALAADPKLIVCDEPVSALDVSIQAQILNLLKDLQQKFGLAYLFISHDLGVVRHIADRVVIMYLGRIVETGTADQIFREPRHPYTQALFSAIPRLRLQPGGTKQLLPGDPPSALAPPAGCHLHPRCRHAIAECRSSRPALVTEGDGHATACHIWRTIEGRQAIPADAPAPPYLKKLVAAFEERNA